ncbi:MAG: hypothetical protein AAGH46_11935, partial [Bacteroidota bacterium]
LISELKELSKSDDLNALKEKTKLLEAYLVELSKQNVGNSAENGANNNNEIIDVDFVDVEE